jgi:TPR repeat protein
LKSTKRENSTAYAGCPAQFWTEDEFVAVLSVLAGKGDSDAAYELAREFYEPRFLRAIAAQGDKDAAFELARGFNEPKFIRTIAEKGDRKAAFMLARKFGEPKFIRVIAEQGDKEAAFELARKFDEPKFIRTRAEQGDRTAAFMLARKFEEPEFIRILAVQGDRPAAIELAEIFGDLGPLRKFAEQGDVQAAFEIYEQLTTGEDLNSDSLKWLCEAANAGHAKARKTLAHLHHSWGEKEGYDIEESNRIAYTWYTLAAASGANTLGSRNLLAKEMTAEDEARAEEMARDWKPGQCPAP